MKIIVLDTTEFKIDGGAYFGVIPKTIWSSKYPCDQDNMCKASCRSLLIEDGERIVLIDTGIGDKQSNNLVNSYHADFSQNLELNIQNAGFSNEDITDVVLTHLHFDHCGGTTKLNNNSGKFELSFPNANHYISKKQWENALNPNYREKSSYVKDNFEILKDSDKLILVTKTTKIGRSTELRLFDGHTPGLMLPIIKSMKHTIFFTGDLIPAMASIPLAWVSAYDLFPLTSIEEKKSILSEACENNWILVFQHDYYNECCDLKLTDKGVRANKTFKLEELLANENE
ncbi:MAG TPA: MBL fold metallo-hydrolase [Bacteroidales bacterium]|nr:MBL fold metallo-hydrolase [Bacteroidales bacterium]